MFKIKLIYLFTWQNTIEIWKNQRTSFHTNYNGMKQSKSTSIPNHIHFRGGFKMPSPCLGSVAQRRRKSIIYLDRPENVTHPVAILACKSWWGKVPIFVLDACQQRHYTTLNNTLIALYCNGDKRCPQAVRAYIKLSPTAELSFQHNGVNPYHCYTWLSAEPCLAAKQLIQPCLLPFF
jgi:hypothetical protein